MAHDEVTSPSLVSLAGAQATAQPLDLDTLYRAYARYMGAIAFRLLGSQADTEEVVQDVFAEALAGLSRLDDPKAVKAWLATIAVRLSRRRLYRRRLFSALGFATTVSFEDHVVQGQQESTLQLKQLAKALDALPVDTRIVWTLRQCEGEDLQTIANRLGCSLATVKRRLCEARMRLRNDRFFEDDHFSEKEKP